MKNLERSRWPCDLRRSSAASRLLESRVWILLRALIFNYLVFGVRCLGCGLCNELITRSNSSRKCLIVCDIETSTMRRPRFELHCCDTGGKKWEISPKIWRFESDDYEYAVSRFWFHVAWETATIFRKSSAALNTYLPTPWCRVLLEKLNGLQLVKKFSAFHGTRKFITALTSVRHLSVSWASPIQSI